MGGGEEGRGRWAMMIIVVAGVVFVNEVLIVVEGLGRLDTSSRGGGMGRLQTIRAGTHTGGRRGAAPATGFWCFVFDYDSVVLEAGWHVVAESGEEGRERERREEREGGREGGKEGLRGCRWKQEMEIVGLGTADEDHRPERGCNRRGRKPPG